MDFKTISQYVQSGILVLDPASIPKWKLVCNKCDVIVRLFEDAAKITVNSEESCPECDSQVGGLRNL